MTVATVVIGMRASEFDRQQDDPTAASPSTVPTIRSLPVRRTLNADEGVYVDYFNDPTTKLCFALVHGQVSSNGGRGFGNVVHVPCGNVLWAPKGYPNTTESEDRESSATAAPREQPNEG